MEALSAENLAKDLLQVNEYLVNSKAIKWSDR